MTIGELYGLGYDDDQRYDDILGKLSAADLQRVAQQYLDANRAVTAVIRPKHQ